MLLRDLKRQRMILCLFCAATFFILFVAQLASANVALAQGDGDPINMERTAENIFKEVQKPLYFVAGAALAVGAIIYMFARGNAEKHHQARLGLGVAIAGFLIGTFALGVLNFAKGLIS
ncbi:MAG: hypothetical protein C4575_00595 [Desulforudis sp.]|jgi:heme/copper-type cytochrome/quinol oxidase subunit 3|nr:MAG: hypothetical protein C4575_00595 [Desulforudis sp.]